MRHRRKDLALGHEGELDIMTALFLPDKSIVDLGNASSTESGLFLVMISLKFMDVFLKAV